jgi:hypothetical protein
MEKICENTQELVAIGAELSAQEHEHLKTCGKCRLLVEEYQSLTLLVSDSTNVEVPLGFADAVMSRIEMEETSAQSDWMQRFANFLDRLMVIPQAQYLALGVGGAVSVVNLMRFVFFVLIPA